MKKLITSNIGTAMIMGLVFSVTSWAAGLGISTWTALVGTLAPGDLVAISDVSDTSGSSAGTSKKITISQLDTYTEARVITSTAGNDLLVKMGDNAGADFVKFRDSDDVSQIYLNSDGNFFMNGEFTLFEQADHNTTPDATEGIIWVKNTSPTTLIFTDDTGADTTLGSGGSFSGTLTDDLVFPELADHDSTPASGYGIMWVDSTETPHKPKFTDENGNDFPVMTNLADDPDPDLSADLDVGTYVILSSSGDVIVKLPSNNGDDAFQVKDSDGVVVWQVDSNGTVGP